MAENFLEIKDLMKSFGTGEAKQEVLRGMNFTVNKGEFCVLLGPSGSGKSTLLNIIGGIDTPDSGFVSINGDKTVISSKTWMRNSLRSTEENTWVMYSRCITLSQTLT